MTAPLFLLVIAITLPTFGAILTIRIFRARSTKPVVGETVVAISTGLIAAALAGVVGCVAAIFACGKFLTGETGEAVLILAPAAVLVSAVLAFVLTIRWILRHGDPPRQACADLEGEGSLFCCRPTHDDRVTGNVNSTGGV